MFAIKCFELKVYLHGHWTLECRFCILVLVETSLCLKFEGFHVPSVSPKVRAELLDLSNVASQAAVQVTIFYMKLCPHFITYPAARTWSEKYKYKTRTMQFLNVNLTETF